jgi:deazaflavin-dependent oxidoreductase (nitroreductase family)
MIRTYNPEFLYLTTTGRKSGQPREIEIWYLEHQGRYYLCAQNRERADWVKNIVQDPAVRFWAKGRTFQGTGRAIHAQADPELHATVSRLFQQRYGWSNGLLVELTPAG